jgi:hypothetical protein
MNFSGKKKGKRPKVRKKRWIILTLVIIFIIGVLASNLSIQSFMIFDAKEIKMDIKVVEGDLAGLNIDNDAIHFGRVPRGGGGTRYITLANNNTNPHLIKIKAFGNISSFVYISENSFVMEPYSTKNLTVMAKPPSDLETGYYEGTLQVLFLNVL